MEREAEWSPLTPFSVLTRKSSSTASRVDLSPKKAYALNRPDPRKSAGNDVPVGFPARNSEDTPAKLGPRFPTALSTQASTVERLGGSFVAASPSSLAQDALACS